MRSFPSTWNLRRLGALRAGERWAGGGCCALAMAAGDAAGGRSRIRGKSKLRVFLKIAKILIELIIQNFVFGTILWSLSHPHHRPAQSPLIPPRGPWIPRPRAAAPSPPMDSIYFSIVGSPPPLPIAQPPCLLQRVASPNAAPLPPHRSPIASSIDATSLHKIVPPLPTPPQVAGDALLRPRPNPGTPSIWQTASSGCDELPPWPAWQGQGPVAGPALCGRPVR
jgi:hypothetical protein